jgi:hypothetical protein
MTSRLSFTDDLYIVKCIVWRGGISSWLVYGRKILSHRDGNNGLGWLGDLRKAGNWIYRAVIGAYLLNTYFDITDGKYLI